MLVLENSGSYSRIICSYSFGYCACKKFLCCIYKRRSEVAKKSTADMLHELEVVEQKSLISRGS